MSGVLRIPFAEFLAVMVGVHLLIGTIEGLITFAVLAYLRQTHPRALGLAAPAGAVRLSRPALAGSLVVVALLLAGIGSWFASTHADGLEWSYRQHRYGGADRAVAPPSPAVTAVDELQSRYTPLPEYGRRETPLGQTPADAPPQAPPAQAQAGVDAAQSSDVVNGWGSLAGLVGTVVTLGLLFGASVVIRRRRPAVVATAEPPANPRASPPVGRV
jgi:cobalt/nickel transport system permease protein